MKLSSVSELRTFRFDAQMNQYVCRRSGSVLKNLIQIRLEIKMIPFYKKGHVPRHVQQEIPMSLSELEIINDESHQPPIQPDRTMNLTNGQIIGLAEQIHPRCASS